MYEETVEDEYGLVLESGVELSARDIDIRQRIFDYAIEQADSVRHKAIGRLYEYWDEISCKYFDGVLFPPVILLDEPGATNSYGECSTESGFGGSNQIQVRPSILDGTLQDLKYGTREPLGLMRFAEHVLLHETVHQWAFECMPRGAVIAESDNYNGHGPIFSTKANEIGKKLGYPTVRRTNKARGKDKDLPSPSQWPHNVCPPDYYLGAYVPVSRDVPGRLLEIVKQIVEEHGEDHLRGMVLLMKEYGYGKVWRAIEEIYPSEN